MYDNALVSNVHWEKKMPPQMNTAMWRRNLDEMKPNEVKSWTEHLSQQKSLHGHKSGG